MWPGRGAGEGGGDGARLRRADPLRRAASRPRTVFGVVKVGEHAHNVRVLQAAVNLDLALELPHGSLVDERLLEDALQDERPPRGVLDDAQHRPEAARADLRLARHREVVEREGARRARLEQRLGVARATAGWRRRHHGGKRRLSAGTMTLGRYLQVTTAQRLYGVSLAVLSLVHPLARTRSRLSRARFSPSPSPPRPLPSRAGCAADRTPGTRGQPASARPGPGLEVPH